MLNRRIPSSGLILTSNFPAYFYQFAPAFHQNTPAFFSFLPTFLNEINGNQNRFLLVSFSIFGASQKYEYDLDVMALFFQEKRTNTQQLVPLPEVKVRVSPVKTPVCTVKSAQSIGNKSIAENSKENESII